MSREVPGYRQIHDGIQIVEHYPNGFGVSIVMHDGSYGSHSTLWEVAVLKRQRRSGRWDLTYDTKVTSDVEGWCTFAQVADLQRKVRALRDRSGPGLLSRKAVA